MLRIIRGTAVIGRVLMMSRSNHVRCNLFLISLKAELPYSFPFSPRILPFGDRFPEGEYVD